MFLAHVVLPEKRVSEVTCYVSSGMLNPIHSHPDPALVWGGGVQNSCVFHSLGPEVGFLTAVVYYKWQLAVI